LQERVQLQAALRWLKAYTVRQKLGRMRRSFSYEIWNQPGALQSLKRDLDKTFFAKEQNPVVRSTVLLVTDELISNLLKYGFRHEAEQYSLLNITLDDDWLQIELKDNGQCFNPLIYAKPKTLKSDLSEREEGGLGIYLVLKMMDETLYQWEEPWNCLTLRKRIRG
jgi:serine/threonine-protein kinase RsbW